MVIDVQVHVDPEDDLGQESYAPRMPGRETLLMHLALVLAGLPEPERVIFHYMAGKVEAEVFLPHNFLENGIALAQAEAEVAKRLNNHPYFSAVSLYCQVAAKYSE